MYNVKKRQGLMKINQRYEANSSLLYEATIKLKWQNYEFMT